MRQRGNLRIARLGAEIAQVINDSSNPLHYNPGIDQITAGRLAPKPCLTQLNEFYKAHQLWFWLIGILVSVIIAAAL